MPCPLVVKRAPLGQGVLATTVFEINISAQVSGIDSLIIVKSSTILFTRLRNHSTRM